MRFTEAEFAAIQARRGVKQESEPFACTTSREPLEDEEQRTVAQFLDLLGFRYCHVPNGGSRNAIEAKRLKGHGVKPGVPDVLIFDPPPDSDYVGVAVELKRRKSGRLSDEQREWLDALTARGWLARCCRGADEAIKFIQEVYGIGCLNSWRAKPSGAVM